MKIINPLPYTCILCNLPSDVAQDLCNTCRSKLPWREPSLDNNAIIPFNYEYPINHLITGLKFNHNLIYARILTDLMLQTLTKHYQDKPLPKLIIPVPLHKKRLRERGFNQALELAKPIAKQLSIPIDFNSCQRTTNTEPQSLIPAKQRHKNIKNAFTVTKKISANHIAIIDDVTTTGSTLDELTITLQQAGMKEIDTWCCAKTRLNA
jgi:ComF family protein